MKVRRGNQSARPSHVPKGRDNFFVSKNSPAKSADITNDDGNPNKKAPHSKKPPNIKQPYVKQKQRKEDGVAGKQFDKKKWRLQKYSKKYKLEQWEERRKNAIMKDYQNQMKVDGTPKVDVKKIYEEYDDDDDDDSNEIDKNVIEDKREKHLPKDFNAAAKIDAKKLPFRKQRLEFAKQKQEKLAKKTEAVRRKSEREMALKKYHDKKIEKCKKLNQKTKRGQPIMKARIEMMLEQIQASKASGN